MNSSGNTTSTTFSTDWTHFATKTSGSTGEPKTITHAKEDLLAIARLQAEALEMDSSSHCLLSLPTDRIAGVMIVLRAQVSQATLHTEMCDAITHISMVPTQLYRHMKDPKPMPNLRALLVGGAPLSPHLFDAAMSAGLPLYTTYGMTETAGMATLRPPTCPTMHAGWPLADVSIRLADNGEIFLKRHKGWFATKDIGKIDETGALHILGRKDRQFISGGKNIQPEEIERALLAIAGIDEATVTPHPHEEWGMRPHATIKGCVTPEEARTHLLTVLERYKVPDKIALSS